MKPAMPLASISLVAIISSAALLGTVLGQALAPTPTPTPMPAPGPESSFSPALPPGPDCFTILLNLSDCLNYVQPGSNLTRPDKPCCPELASLVDSAPVCLCKLLGDPQSAGVSIDINRALKLPSACAVTTPPLSLCSVLGVPVSAPLASEGPSAQGGVPPSSVASAPSKPENQASRSIASAGVFGAVALVSMFF